METKRCTHCQKLSRADARICRRCGNVFEEERERVSKAPMRTGRFVSRSGIGHSIPPASPHKAGHYAGLHPEDQPYQSTFMPTLHPPSSSLSSPSPLPHHREPDVIVLAGVEPPSPEPVPASADTRNVADIPTFIVAPVEPVHPQRVTPLPISAEMLEEPYLEPYTPMYRRLGRVIPIALTVFVLLLLITGSIFAFLLVNRHTYDPRITPNPNQVRISDMVQLTGSGFGANDLISFTHDDSENPMLDGSGHAFQARTDFSGAFNVNMVIPSDWSVGEHSLHANDAAQGVGATTPITILPPSSALPQLHLAATSVSVGSAGPGVVSNKMVTLINAGGGLLGWQASSDEPWLTISPNNGTFSGRAAVQVTVNRGTLVPLSYTGHVLFTLRGSNTPPLILTVHMSVIAAPASLTVSSVALNYSGSTIQNPAAQTITLQNSDSHAVDWSSATETGNGAAWLALSPSSGHLAPQSAQTITVSVQSQQLAPGTYQGTIYFNGGANPQVTVSLTVVAPGSMIVSPPSLNFASTGQNPATQTMTLQNSGGEALYWSENTTTVDGANWLTITPSSGYLGVNESVSVAIAINAVTLKPNSYQGMLNFNYGSDTKLVAVSLTVSVPLLPAIKLSTNVLSYNTVKGHDPAPQTFTITNTGNTTLNWTIVEDANGITYLPLTPTSGSLLPNNSAVVSVSPSVQQASAGTIVSHITVADSSANPKVPNQSVATSITVSDIPVLNLSTNSIVFNNNSNITHSFQIVAIANTGSQPLNWQIQPSLNASWLTISSTTGTIYPNGNFNVDMECNSTSLIPGTYIAELVVRDTDAGTPVPAQTIVITLKVS